MNENCIRIPNRIIQQLASTVHACTPVFVGLLIMLACQSAFAKDDDYLNALASEAEASAEVSSKNSAAEPSKDQAELEKLLQDEKPTTFKYYKKLSQHDKNKVVELFSGNNSDQAKKLSHLRKKVLDLYFKR